MTSTDPRELVGPAPDAGGDRDGTDRGGGGGAPSLGYLPALDGLRGLAAAGVVLYHAGVGWMQGGFLAVTTFFALSGFLLTSLIVREHATTGRISATRFWGRRFRRLLPAALVTLAGVSVAGRFLATPEQLANLRGDVLASLFYVINWRFIVEGRAYTDLFSDPSPLKHFWTLSVEEQIFLVLPLVVLAAAAIARPRRGRRPTGAPDRSEQDRFRRVLGVGLAAATVASVVLMARTYDVDTAGLDAYFSTLTRAAEFLVGALAAVLLARPQVLDAPVARATLALAGIPALAAVVAVWALTPDGARWLFHGGFAAVALGSTVVIAAGLRPGPLRGMLSWRPLRELGKRSYGVYLYHWPVLLWLTEDRAGIAGDALLAVQLLLTGVLAWASYRFIEQPIRTRRRLTTRGALVAAPAAMVLVAGLAVATTTDPPPSELVFDPLPDPVTTTVPAPPDAPVGEDDPDPSPPDDGIPVDGEDEGPLAGVPDADAPALGADGETTVLVVGDSVARNLVGGLARLDPQPFTLWDRTSPGCGLVTSEVRVEAHGWQTPRGHCDPPWRERWPEAIERIDPDVVLLQVGTAETWDRRIDGEELLFDSPEAAAHLTDELVEAVDLLSARGAPVLLVTLPVSEWRTWGLNLYDEQRSVNNPAWVQRWNDLLGAAAARRPGRAAVADLAGLLTPEGQFVEDLDGVTVRAGDGLHLTEAGADLSARWLSPRLLKLAAASSR